MFMYQRTPAEMTFHYDNETFVSTAIITTNGARKQSEFVAYATCHKDDHDFESVNTGRIIATNRVYIKYLKSELAIVSDKLAILKYLSDSVTSSPKYNERGFTEKKLKKLIDILELGAWNIKQDIATLKKETDELIKAKENLWNKIRERRGADAQNQKLTKILEGYGIRQEDNPFKDKKDYSGMTYLGELIMPCDKNNEEDANL